MWNVVTWPRGAWSIFDELESLHDVMGGTVGGGYDQEQGSRGWRRRMEYPVLNAWSSESGITLDAYIPGVDEKDLELSIHDDEITIKGKVNTAEQAQGEKCLRRERPSGEFTRTLQLPFKADVGAVKATLRNGVLRVTVPRSPDEKPRRVAIQTA